MAGSKKISEGIKKGMDEYNRTGKITTSRAVYHPKSKANAKAIKAAIMYSEQRRGKKKK